MKNFSQSILPPWNVPVEISRGPPVEETSRCFRFIPGIPRGVRLKDLGEGWPCDRAKRREGKEGVHFSECSRARGIPHPPPCFFDAPPTGYFAFCYIIAGFDYAKRRPPQAVCTLLPSLLLLSLPRLRSRPLSLPGHVGGPSSPLTFRGKPHLRIFIGIIPARFMKIESGSPISRTVSRLFFLIF